MLVFLLDPRLDESSALYNFDHSGSLFANKVRCNVDSFQKDVRWHADLAINIVDLLTRTIHFCFSFSFSD